jgi:hypothetical protein
MSEFIVCYNEIAEALSKINIHIADIIGFDLDKLEVTLESKNTRKILYQQVLQETEKFDINYPIIIKANNFVQRRIENLIKIEQKIEQTNDSIDIELANRISFKIDNTTQDITAMYKEVDGYPYSERQEIKFQMLSYGHHLSVLNNIIISYNKKNPTRQLNQIKKASFI